MVEDLRRISSEATRRELERVALGKTLREQTALILEKDGKRRPNYRAYLSIPILPILPLVYGMVWAMERINPLDFSTKKVLKIPPQNGESLSITSSEGNPRGSYEIKIAIGTVSRLILYPDGKGVISTIHDPNGVLKRSIDSDGWIGDRNVSTDELLAYQKILQSLSPHLSLTHK